MSEQFQRAKWPDDVAARIELGRAAGKTWEAIGVEFGVTVATIRHKAATLGLLVPRSLRRFTPEEDAVIRADYSSHVPVEVIAEKLNRSPGVIRQRIYHHMSDLVNTIRSAPGTKALKRYGAELLNHGASPAEALACVREKLIEAKAHARVMALEAKAVRQRERIKSMLDQIAAGRDRNEAIFEARSSGATLEEIGDAIGITRERVRQIYDATALKIAARNVSLSIPGIEAAQ